MRGGWLRGYTIVYLVFLYAPILLLPIFAFNNSTIIAFNFDSGNAAGLQGFTGKWFGELAKIRALHEAVGNSLIIAVTSSVFATVLGLLTARASTRFEFPGRGPVVGLIMLPLVLPDIIVAVSLLIVVVQLLDFGLSRWTIVAAHTLMCTPFSVAILNSAFQNLDASLEEASIDLGETPWSTFRLITLPLVMPGIIASLLIGFTISLDEFIVAFFLSGTQPTLPVYIWSLLRFPAKLPVVMALGTILVVMSVIILVIAEHFRRRGVARAGAEDHGGFL